MGHTPKMVADFRVSLVTVIALDTAMRLKSKLSSGNALYPEFGYVFLACVRLASFVYSASA